MKKLVALAVLAVTPAAFADTPPGAAGKRAGADASYVLKVDAPAAKKGQKSVAKIHLTPGAGFHMNKEYPTSLVLSAVPTGVSIDKMKQTMKDAAKWDEAEGEFDIAYTAAEAGKKVVTGEIKFAVCSANTCDPKKSNVSFEIDVK